MSMESEDQCYNKELKIAYTREFLCCLAELDMCKRLPSGFDPSILGELNDASITTTYRDSDSGRCHGNLTRDSWKTPEEGLLGSGAFPRLPGCGSGVSAQTVQDKGYSLLSRSNKPYRPPHFYKANPHSGKQSKDSYNDETFGSSDCLSWEKLEEERKRRDSFELIRKEQHAIQGKQKKISDEHKENVDPEIATFPEESRNDKRLMSKCNESVECVVSSAPNIDSAKHYSSTHTSACGQLLPPDVTSRFLEKNLGSDSFTTPASTPEQGGVIEDHPKRPQSYSSIHQFLEEGKKPADGISSGSKSGDPKVYRVSNEKVTEQSSSTFSSGRNELPQKLIPSATTVNSEQLNSCNKSTVTPRVLNSEDFKQSILPEVNENLSTRHHCDTEDRQPNSTADQGASEHLLSLLQNGAGLIDLAASSKLNMKCSDKVNLFEIGNDSNMLDISRKENTENFRKNLTARQIFGAGFTKDLRATELPVSQKGSVGRVTGNDNFERCRFPFPVDNSIIPLTEDGSFGISYDGIISSRGAKQTGLSKVKGKQSRYDDIKALIGLDLESEEETKLGPVRGFDEKANWIDELCLPEEDSLIIDYSLFPQDSMVMPAKNPMRDHLFTSSASLDVAEKFANLNVTLSGKGSTRPDLRVPTSLHSFHDYYNPHARQSYPQFHHSQTRPTRAFFCPSQAEEAHKIKSLGLDNYHYTPPGHHHFPTDVLSNPQLKHAEPTRHGNPVIHPMLQQMPIPGEFPPHQLNEQARGAPTHHPINEMAHYAQEWNSMQNFPQNHLQLSYGGLEKLTPDRNVGGKDNQAAYNTLFEMEARAKHMHPLAVSGRGQGTFGRQVDMGFRFR